jgi:hypothetical protein
LPLLAFALLGILLSWWKTSHVPSGGGTTRLEAAIERFAAEVRRRLPFGEGA